jgi:AbrB family looped-hinge helix DNA binding protein
MLIAIDKRGSINLPAAMRRQLGLEIGSYLDLQVAEGGLVSCNQLRSFGLYVFPNQDWPNSMRPESAERRKCHPGFSRIRILAHDDLYRRPR